MRHRKLVILNVVLAVSGIAALVGASSNSYEAKTLPLSSLQNCRLRSSWIGFWPRFPEGVMLYCGDTEFLVLQPNNLLGHVQIATSAQALEYVRLFTQSNTYMYFDMGGMVELFERDVNASSPTFNTVEPRLFRKYLRPTRVEYMGTHACKPGVVYACGKEFQVTRPVVLLNQEVYEVIESVYESGFYSLVTKKRLLKDATRIGVQHFGEL